MRGLRIRKGSRAGVGNPIPGATPGRSAGPAIGGGVGNTRSFAPGGPANPTGLNDAGFQLLEGMQRGIRPAPLVGASPGGGPWVKSGRKTRSYFGP